MEVSKPCVQWCLCFLLTSNVTSQPLLTAILPETIPVNVTKSWKHDQNFSIYRLMYFRGVRNGLFIFCSDFFANHSFSSGIRAVDPGIRIRSVRNTCDFKFFNVASILKSETEQWFMMIYFVELVSTSRSTIQRGIGVDEITSNGWFPAFRTVMQRNTCHRGDRAQRSAQLPQRSAVLAVPQPLVEPEVEPLNVISRSSDCTVSSSPPGVKK